MTRTRTLLLLAALLVPAAPRSAFGQERGAVALDQLVRGLTTSSRVLVIGAHPDDEDTRFLAWLARGHQVHVAYLSLTRGDGGQNQIGNELGESLGALRTEELLAARRLDGAQQYFARAFDFGFSKDAAETFTQWDREGLTADVVRVIRAFRPHVVVAVWSGTRADGHGHHEASGILARDGYDAAGDTVRFPEERHGRAWVPMKFYRGTWVRSVPSTLSFDVGGFDAVMGRSTAELAAESRSQHRSQGQGELEQHGAVISHLIREATRVNDSVSATSERSLFDGVDTTVRHLGDLNEAVKGSIRRAAALADWVQRSLDLRHPELVVDSLAQLVVQLEAARLMAPRCGAIPRRSFRNPDGTAPPCPPADRDLDASVDRLLDRARSALLAASGVRIEVEAQKELLAFGDSMPVRITVYNRGKSAIVWRGLRLTGSPTGPSPSVEIAPDSSYSVTRIVIGLVDHRPWWVGGRNGAMFVDTRSPEDGVARVSYAADAALVPSVSLAEDVRRLSDVRVTLWIGTGTTTFDAGAIDYRFADAVFGEQRRPAGGVPPITLELDRGLEWVRAGVPIDRRLRVTVRSHTDHERRMALRFLLPEGIRVEGTPDSLVLAAGEVKELFVRLRGTLKEGRHEFGVAAASDGSIYAEGFRDVIYPHVRPIRLYRSSAVYLQAVPVTIPRGLVVAYVTGVSDAIAPALRGLEIPLTILTPAELPLLDLSRFSTVVIGPRAYQAAPDLVTQNPRLLEWVRGGGTLVVQYGQGEMARPGMMPYPVEYTRPAARVTLEKAPVRVATPASKLLTWPMRITPADWDDWVQERALYMPSTIDARYRTPIAMNDPDEPENRGAILDAPLGKGRYVYTTLSIFRQVPAGVPGAVRILVNLMSAGIVPPQR